jgi:hypothetical protein
VNQELSALADFVSGDFIQMPRNPFPGNVFDVFNLKLLSDLPALGVPPQLSAIILKWSAWIGWTVKDRRAIERASVK